MPYLHWETDRGRMRSADCAKEASKNKFRFSEIAHQAQNQLSAGGLPGSRPGTNSEQESTSVSMEPMPRRQALGKLLLSAAALLEDMEFHVEEQLTLRYLHENPPLHPRRTLDQFYYGALKNTGTRDRDQVVYRETTPEQHKCNVKYESCNQCGEDIRKVPRLVMVDQLWLWILDESSCNSVTVLVHFADAS